MTGKLSKPEKGPGPGTGTARFIVWVAEGFGVGRIPFAPGTWGSLLGIVWFVLLLLPSHMGIFVTGISLSVADSIWICGRAEAEMGRNDPPSLVLDEVVAMPLCFVFWVIGVWRSSGSFPGPGDFFSNAHLFPSAGVFLAFRLFDIWKPYPIRNAQAWPGGWGVVMDDLLAAALVNLLVAVIWVVKGPVGF